MQLLAWLLTLGLVSTIAAFFLYVILNAKAVAGAAEATQAAYRLRGKLFWGLVVVGLPAMAVTLFDLPYVRASHPPVQQVVNVKAFQWYWEIDRDKVHAGTPVEFRVTAGDVNHGVGLFDPSMQLIAQTQAMPGYVNSVRYVFSKPGVYRILCLEFCGIAHHAMVAEIEVVP